MSELITDEIEEVAADALCGPIDLARATLEAAAPLIAARALEEAADAFDLDVASARFIASDGVPSVGINTNDEARKLVTDWLRARAREGRG